jgi:transcriptional regulator with XRE-family HTH domain
MSSKIFTSSKIDPLKPIWSAADWHIYINNLELLCSDNSLKKKDFSKRIGVVNAFRTSAGRPSAETIKKISEIFDVTTDWLMTYHDKLNYNIKQEGTNYDPHGGWKPRSIEQLVGLPDGHGMGRAVEMLARIYASRNENVIRAIFANLRVFCERVDQDDEIANLKREMAELRDLVKNHAKAHAYYGEDRRSGVDRRQTDGIGPGGIERRSGLDRRKTEEGNGAD